MPLRLPLLILQKETSTREKMNNSVETIVEPENEVQVDPFFH